MLQEFTHFIFTTVDTYLSLQTQIVPQNTHILSKSTLVLYSET